MDDKFNQQSEELVQNYSFDQDFRRNRFKSLVPEIFAAVVTMSNYISIGKCFGYSAILIPQLLDDQHDFPYINNSNASAFRVSESETSWIASAPFLIMIPTAFLSGVIIDLFGRLNTMKLSGVPNILGWILIATAKNFTLLIIGRSLIGIAVALVSCTANVYVTEISSPSIRGALISLNPCFFSLGITMVYLEGWFFTWKTVAWISVIYISVPLMFLILWLPESPSWLVSKNKIEQAKESLAWLKRYKMSNRSHELVSKDADLSALLRDNMRKQEVDATANKQGRRLRLFTCPTVYKPLAILAVLQLIVQLSGIFVLLVYAVLIFREVGINISAYFAAVLIGLIRFGMSIVTIFLMKRYSRRSLAMLSALCMAISIGISGLFTTIIKGGNTSVSWVPVAMVLLYIASTMIGILPISFTIGSELFPTEVRGLGNGLSFVCTYAWMFATIQLYYTLLRLFGGIVGLQYFFAAISLSGVLYSYIFLPETHNKKLPEIQEYFKLHWTYISLKSAKRVHSNKNDRASSHLTHKINRMFKLHILMSLLGDTYLHCTLIL